MKIRKRLPKMSVESPQEQVGVGGGALLIASAVAATRAKSAAAAVTTVPANRSGTCFISTSKVRESRSELGMPPSQPFTSDSDSSPFALLTGPVILPSPTAVVAAAMSAAVVATKTAEGYEGHHPHQHQLTPGRFSF